LSSYIRWPRPCGLAYKGVPSHERCLCRRVTLPEKFQSSLGYDLHESIIVFPKLGAIDFLPAVMRSWMTWMTCLPFLHGSPML
jgi:hypothetical protein